jgi:hypothetical protein
MAQHDYVIDNQASASARNDLNSLFQAIASQNSGATAPATAYANQIWYDTANDLLKMRNEANTAWITLGTLDQALNTFTAPSVNGKTVGTLTAAGGIAYATSASALAAIGAGTAGQILLSGGAGAPTWSNFSVIDYQAFTASGTWTKPAGISANAVVLVELWAGGGSGGRGGSTYSIGNGGGGGGYTDFVALASAISSPQTITVGAGGVGVSAAGSGNTGGLSSFGSLVAVYGGTGGAGNTNNGNVGIGGSFRAAGVSSGNGETDGQNGGSAYLAKYGGGGGKNFNAGSGTGNNLSLLGGSGGSTNGASGSAPAGGGAGLSTNSGTSGAGARGEVRVWTIG